MLTEPLLDNDAGPWNDLREKLVSYLDAHKRFFESANDPLSILRENLKSGSRSIALMVIRDLDDERKKQLLNNVIPIACYISGYIVLAREIIFSLPKEWLVANIASYAESFINTGDEDDYNGLLSLYSFIDHGLVLALAQRAFNNSDPSIKEIGRLWLADTDE